ncbi:MAG: type II toxin-antitoxin system HicB family antitoxin [Ignavibacteriae bacterium]|nr:MAG: type II toxin-antitoxin system HicB family antitoxin [Ignavibacteriota bacterium]
MKNNITHYMILDYEVVHRRLTKEEGGGYIAYIPQLGRNTFQADGETLEEALANLEIVKKELFKDFIKKGYQIPEPESQEQEYSGKFIVRVPKFLHKELVSEAKKNNSSLNQYVLTLLSKNLYVSDGSTKYYVKKSSKRKN